jgi:class 3 adenylate cyclase/tetratricopeptide (TPR) repeat protein
MTVANAGPATAATELTRLLADNASPLEIARRLVAANDPNVWSDSPQLHIELTRRLIGSGHTTAAFDHASRVLAVQKNPTLAYQRALALARGRNIAMARAALAPLLDSIDQTDRSNARLLSDVLSLSGRLHKDEARYQRDPAQRRRCFAQAMQAYAQSFEITGEYFPAINAATMALLADGADRRARKLAEAVLKITSAEAQKPGSAGDYWLQATMGEASVILRRWESAAAHYETAVKAAAGRVGDIASMRRNLQLLATTLPIPPGVLAAVSVGPVLVFSGHMIDQPGRRTPRFPDDAGLEQRVRQAIAAELDRLKPAQGYCSAACGSDILFAEEMLKRGCDVHIVLPFALDDFYEASVDFGLRSMHHWRQRCDAVLSKASVHYATKERYLGDDVLFEFANRLMQGLAVVRAEELGVEPEAIVVCDGGASALTGGTLSFVEAWRSGNRRIALIELGGLRDGVCLLPTRGGTKTKRRRPHTHGRRIQHMLFCDVKNFSQLREEHARDFVVRFERAVMHALKRSKAHPVFVNTWGDALYAVFDRATACARFATELLAGVAEVDWAACQLPADTTLRIGVHAGPVYRHRNKLIHRPDVIGSHVTLAARIEPVTTPGSTYVSEHFAAELALEAGEQFVCEYVGIHDLAKKYGPLPLYRLDARWRRRPTKRKRSVR